MKEKNKNKKGFTLIELLVVVLIIGILAAVTFPQYRIIVAKANFHRGFALVESLYQAEQSYYNTQGQFTADIDDLEISAPIDSSCTRQGFSGGSKYKCDFGVIGIFDSTTNVQYQTKDGNLGYLHYFKDWTNSGVTFKAGQRYCYADSEVAAKVCKEMGGTQVHDGNNSWRFGLYIL